MAEGKKIKSSLKILGMPPESSASGLNPMYTTPYYEISTDQASNFMRKKFDDLTMLKRKKEGNDSIPTIDEVFLTTINISKKFRPFMLIMSSDVQVQKKKKNRIKGELSIFHPAESAGFCRLDEPYYKFVTSFIFNKNDEKAFFSNMFRESQGISLHNANFLKNNRIPHVQRFDGGRRDFVEVLIDPVRLFRYMLADEDFSIDGSEKRDFDVEVIGLKKIDESRFIYCINRIPLIGKKKKGKSNSNFESKIAFEINRRLTTKR